MKRKKIKRTAQEETQDNDSPTRDSQPPTSRKFPMSIIILLFFLSLLVIYHFTSSTQPRNPSIISAEEDIAVTEDSEYIVEDQDVDSSHPFPFRIDTESKIPVVQWDYRNKLFALKLTKRAEPVIIRNSPAAKWNALKEWNPDYFLKHIGRPLEFVKHCRSGTFLLGEQEGHDDHKMDYVSIGDMTIQNFLEHANSTQGVHYYYYSAPVESWGKRFEDDIQPNEPFYFRKLSDQEDTFRTMVWMGDRGVNAQLHYDEPVNFFVQIYGRKSWILLPPSEHRKLYTFPHLSTHKRQSQVNLNHYDAQRFPDFKNIRAREVTLEPGDVLFVPPYWAHYVRTLDFSISVSLLNPSYEEIHIGKVYLRSLPFGKYPVKSQDRILLVRLYILMLAEQLSREDPSTFVRNLVFKPRYAPNYTKLTSKSDLPATFNCYKNSRGSDVGRKYLQDLVNKQISAFKDKDFDQIIRDIKFGDYVEMLAEFAAGKDNVALYLNQCF